MNTININRLAVATLSALSALSGLVSAQAQTTTLQQQWAKQSPQPASETLRSTRDFSTKASADNAAVARQKLGYKTTVVYDSKRNVYILREYGAATPGTTTTGATTPNSNPMLSRREFDTQASADAAAAARQKLGYKTTVVYDPRNHVYILREYGTATTPTTPDVDPMLSRREFDTQASANAAAAARQKLGYKTTVVYDSRNHVYILREYGDAATSTTHGVDPMLSRRDFDTQASANAAAAARQKLGYKTTVVYDSRNHVYILREYGDAATPTTTGTTATGTTTPNSNPMLSRREFDTQASATAAAAARRKLGFKTTVVYDSRNHVYILREYSGHK